MSGLRLVCALVLLASVAHGAAPRLDALLPPGGQAGGTNTVTALGSFAAWPAELWCSHPGIRFAAQKKKGEFSVSIAPDVPPGPYLARLHSKDGASDARFFVVGTLPEILEREDNGTLAAAQVITNLPVVINGRLGKSGDTDFFKLRLQRGQTLSASLDGYRLRSLIDPFIRLHDPRGYEVALASDTHTLDPFLYYRARETGDYHLQIFAIAHKASTSVAFAGSSAAVYRLTLATNGVTCPAAPIEAQVQEAREGEQPQTIKAPTTLAGTLGKSGEIDRYRFAAAKGDQFLVRVESHRLGYPADPVMRILRPDGRLLREVDDTKPYRDPEYLLKAGEGDYTVEIRDRFRRGGSDYRYRLVIERPEPAVEITCDREIFIVEAGKTNDLKLKLTRRNGHNAKLNVVLRELPEGLSLRNGEIDGKARDATVKLVAAADAPAHSGPIRILLRDSSTDPPALLKASRSFITADSRGDYLLNGADWFWLIVKPAPAKPDATEKEPAAKN